MRRLQINRYLVFFLVLLCISISPIAAYSPQNQSNCPSDAEFFRSVEVITGVRVENAVRVRTEAGTSGGDGTVLFTAVVDQEFDIRPDVETVEADGYTWIPIIADDQDAWIAQEGFVELVTEMVDEPISQEEIDEACDSDLPEGASEIVAIDNQLHAVDADSEVVAVWYWGDETRGGAWGSPIPSFDEAPDDDTEFLEWYQWSAGDDVQLVRTGIGRPEDVNDYWTISITRDNLTRSNLPLREQVFGSIVTPIGMVERTSQFEDFSYQHSEVSAVYVGLEELTDSNEYAWVFAISNRDRTDTLLFKARVPKNYYFTYFNRDAGGFTFGTADVIFQYSQENLFTLQQVNFDLLHRQDQQNVLETLVETLELDCDQGECEDLRVGLGDNNLTPPESLQNWWSTGDQSGLVVDEFGVVETAGISIFNTVPPTGVTIRN